MTLDVVEADIARRVPDLIIRRAMALQQEYACLAWAVESVQFQEFLRTELIRRAAEAGIAFPAVAVPQIHDKDLRILSLQPYVGNGQIRLHRHQSTLYTQLHFYPEADHDDGPDALHMLWQLAQQYRGGYQYIPVADSGRAGRAYDGDDDDALDFLRGARGVRR